MELELKAAFDIYMKHRDAIMGMWQFFSFVTLGILGFTVGSKSGPLSKTGLFVVIAGYASFALANAYAVITSQIELLAMTNAIRIKLKCAPVNGIEPGFCVQSIAYGWFILFYVVISLLVCYAIYATNAERAVAPTKTNMDPTG